jgi:ribonucleoside-diphosphate reductase alpha chain
MELSENAAHIMNNYYLTKNVNGEVVETPDEAVHRICEVVSEVERTPEQRAFWYKEFHRIIDQRLFSPNSPTWTGAKRTGQLLACFVVDIQDSMTGIFEAAKKIAKIQQSGGGTGMAFNLRPENSAVIGGIKNLSDKDQRSLRAKKAVQGTASGPLSFMENTFNLGVTEVTKQGSVRRGANMGILRCDHPDIRKFITYKSTLNERHRNVVLKIKNSLLKNPELSRLLTSDPEISWTGEALRGEGEPLDKVLNIIEKSLINEQLKNFNISVAATDKFINAARWREPWELKYNNKIYNIDNAGGILDLIAENAWASGEPGLFFIDRANEKDPCPHMGPIQATNPCVTADTLVYTENGLQRIADLTVAYNKEGTCPGIVVDGRRSEPSLLPVTRFIYSGEKPVYRLTTREGFELKVTRDHKIMTQRGWVEAGNLRQGDRVHILNREGSFGLQGTYSEGALLGMLVGDGTINKKRAMLSFWGEDRELVERFVGLTNEVIRPTMSNNKVDTLGAHFVKVRQEARIGSTRLREFAESHGISSEDKLLVPESVFKGSKEMQQGFLQALFSADGQVNFSEKKSCLSVRLTSVKYAFLQDVQRLLLNHGIYSVIYKNRKSYGMTKLPDGKGGSTDYFTQGFHDLVISKTSLLRFAEKIPFMQSSKASKLLEALAAYTKGPYSEKFEARFEALHYLGNEPVFDLTQPETQSFIANGIVVHNCGEQSLRGDEACDLGSICVQRHLAQKEDGTWVVDWPKLRLTVQAAVRFLDNVIDASVFPLPEITEAVKRTRRIGLGVMGVADALFLLRIPYNSIEGLLWKDQLMGFIHEIAHETSVALAREREPFPEWEKSRVGYRRNATLDCLAPTGTIGQISDSSTGMEPLYALAYGKNLFRGGYIKVVHEQFVKDAEKEGVWTPALEEHIMACGTLRGYEGALPDWMRRVYVTAGDLHWQWHVASQAVFQKNVDNGVSKTVNLQRSASVEDVQGAYFMAHDLGCMGITVYRDGSRFEQPIATQKSVKLENPEPMSDGELALLYKLCRAESK